MMKNNETRTDVDSYDITLAVWLYDFGIRGNYDELANALSDLDYDEIGQFIAEKVEKFKDSKWDDMNEGINECILNYIGDNNDKWIRELKGDNLYKVKVVVEVDIESPWKLDEVVKEVQHRLDIGLDGIFEDETHTIINAVGKEVNE